MTCLVTRAAGFIGSHVSQALLDEGHEVVGLDDLSGGFAENRLGPVRLVRSSMLDVELLPRLFAEHDYVFHLAAHAAEGLSHFIGNLNGINRVVGPRPPYVFANIDVHKNLPPSWNLQNC